MESRIVKSKNNIMKKTNSDGKDRAILVMFSVLVVLINACVILTFLKLSKII